MLKVERLNSQFKKIYKESNMNNEWKITKIGFLGKVITGKTPSTQESDNFGDDYPFITIPDLDGRVFIEKTERSLSKKGASKVKGSLLPANAVMMSCIATVGKCGITTKPSFTNQQINSVICDKDTDPRFLYYVFTQLGNELDSFGGGGSVYANISKSRFSDIDIKIPPLPEQRAIAEVLSALDDKIELNRRMNQTLESLAQAIFKHMFIDNPEREGWVEAKLDSICRFEYGKALKAEHRKNGNIPVFGSNGCVGYHDDYLVKGPGIIIGRIGNPGTVMFSFTDFFVIDTAFYIVPKNSTNIYWLYYALKELNLPNLGAYSAVPGLNRNIAYLSEITIPPSKLCLNFESVIRPIFEKKYLNDQESNILAELRDTLLPRLMSGQVRVV